MAWIWSFAVVATLVAFALAWRAVARADRAASALDETRTALAVVPATTRTLRDQVEQAARHRRDLADRPLDGRG